MSDGGFTEGFGDNAEADLGADVHEEFVLALVVLVLPRPQVLGLVEARRMLQVLGRHPDVVEESQRNWQEREGRETNVNSQSLQMK